MEKDGAYCTQFNADIGLCGAVSDPLIRNAQEKRQLATIEEWLEGRGYHKLEHVRFNKMEPGTFSFRTNIPVFMTESDKTKVNIPVDVLNYAIVCV